MDVYDEVVVPRFSAGTLQEVATAADNDGADEFFSRSDQENIFSTPRGKEPIREKFYTPAPVAETPFRDVLPTVEEEDEEEENDITNPLTDITNQTGIPDRIIIKAKRRLDNAKTDDMKNPEPRSPKESPKVFEGIVLDNVTEDKIHNMTTRKDIKVKTPTIDLRSRVVNREALKRKGSLMATNKYIPLSEQIYRFQKDTPPRFKKNAAKELPAKTRLTVTIAESPKLRTKERAKLSLMPKREENQKQTETDNKKKSLARAMNFNRKIFQPPDNSKKPAPRCSTVPEPFKLTKAKPKEKPQEDQPAFHFKARPVPKMSLSAAKRKLMLSHSSLSNFLEEDDNKNDCNIYSGIMSVPVKIRKTSVTPFSFEERDKQRLKEKEAKIKKIIEEETKVPQFHARPMPRMRKSTNK